MKKYKIKETLITVIFFAGFVLGVLFVNLWGNTYLKENQWLCEESLRLVCRTEIDAQAFFWYILSARGKCFLLLTLLGYTAAGLLAVLFFLGWLGFSAGMFLSIFVVRMRFLGILMFLVSVLPQAFFYVPLVWMMACNIYDRWLCRFRSREALGDWQREKIYLQAVLFQTALLVPGMMLESFVNPWLLKQTVNYFF